MDNLAPILLFVYNRPFHTKKTIEALKANLLATQSDLIIFSDAAKNTQAINLVKEVRSLINRASGFKSIKVYEKDINAGLSKSIINGVTQIIEEYGKVIVLEDDLITSPFFLKYMNDALTKYESEERIISIHGYVYPINEELPDYFFLKGADCWGWGTWKRGWDSFQENGNKLLKGLTSKKLEYRFDFYDSYPYTKMLKDQINGKNDSWAIRWYASAFLNDKLTLYPGKSFINNIGNDNSGTHNNKTFIYDSEINIDFKELPNIVIQENESNVLKFARYFRTTHSHKTNFLYKILSFLKA